MSGLDRESACARGSDSALREKSTYQESLETLNASLKERGKAPIVIKPLPLALEDEDILEMVNAGLVKITANRIRQPESLLHSA
jgi:hypothetical protein